MRDFIEAVYEYPWTSFFILVAIIAIINKIKEKSIESYE
jgi:Tfp pilus assembly major pilin PilA